MPRRPWRPPPARPRCARASPLYHGSGRRATKTSASVSDLIAIRHLRQPVESLQGGPCDKRGWVLQLADGGAEEHLDAGHVGRPREEVALPAVASLSPEAL